MDKRQPPPNAGKGRPKGAVNKTTKTVREAILQAFDKLGGVKFLVVLGRTHPVEFARLLGRLLPREVTVTSTSTAPPPPALSDPQVLAAALALDEVVDAVSHAPGARPLDAPALPLGTVPSPDSEAPAAAADEATPVAEREAVQAPHASDPATTREIVTGE